jgi:hypothetical protein
MPNVSTPGTIVLAVSSPVVYHLLGLSKGDSRFAPERSSDIDFGQKSFAKS